QVPSRLVFKLVTITPPNRNVCVAAAHPFLRETASVEERRDPTCTRPPIATTTADSALTLPKHACNRIDRLRGRLDFQRHLSANFRTNRTVNAYAHSARMWPIATPMHVGHSVCRLLNNRADASQLHIFSKAPRIARIAASGPTTSVC